ncbi:MAG: hypothetical protein LBU05_01155 [Bifidobacteriaceae bacterium]|jgi:hypothetical protein|nr:hypothetical protein [Bifidobacteriaceae bacterium]
MTEPKTPKPPEGIDYSRVTVQLVVLASLLALAGSGLGYFLDGAKGLWGALVGAAIVGFFFAASSLVMHLSKTPEAKARNLLIAWFAKLIVLFIVLLALNQASFISRQALGVTILIGVIGSLVLEGKVVWSARLPPGPGPTAP